MGARLHRPQPQQAGRLQRHATPPRGPDIPPLVRVAPPLSNPSPPPPAHHHTAPTAPAPANAPQKHQQYIQHPGTIQSPPQPRYSDRLLGGAEAASGARRDVPAVRPTHGDRLGSACDRARLVSKPYAGRGSSPGPVRGTLSRVRVRRLVIDVRREALERVHPWRSRPSLRWRRGLDAGTPCR